MVLTRDEDKRVLAQRDGTHGLMARLLYGGGMRPMKCVRITNAKTATKGV